MHMCTRIHLLVKVGGYLLQDDLDNLTYDEKIMKSPLLWIVGICLAIWAYHVSTRQSQVQPFVYTPYTPPQSTYTPPTSDAYFMGYPCTDDCSGHRAGYQWAKDSGIDDPDDCRGKSNSFIEGCRAYAEDLQEFMYQAERDRRRPR